MGRLTRPQAALLKALSTGKQLCFSQDGEDGWCWPGGPDIDDICVTPEDLSYLRRVGFIGADSTEPAEERFSAPEVITEAGRRALAQEQG